jgi:D-amino-acid dehydrogenase
MNHISIIGGIVGLSSAYYLHEAGYKVTVFDKGDLSDNCSYGNAGYVCPTILCLWQHQGLFGKESNGCLIL